MLLCFGTTWLHAISASLHVDSLSFICLVYSQRAKRCPRSQSIPGSPVSRRFLLPKTQRCHRGCWHSWWCVLKRWCQVGRRVGKYRRIAYGVFLRRPYISRPANARVKPYAPRTTVTMSQCSSMKSVSEMQRTDRRVPWLLPWIYAIHTGLDW